MTISQYIKMKQQAGKFPMIVVSPGAFGTFWLEDENFTAFKGACFTSREAAEKARSKALDKGRKWIEA